MAADASVLMPVIRRRPCTQVLADADQRLFALYRSGAKFTRHAETRSAIELDRSMLANAQDNLGPSDMLMSDRGYPATWFVDLLDERGICFVLCCDSSSGG